jgi:hypothetical protein
MSDPGGACLVVPISDPFEIADVEQLGGGSEELRLQTPQRRPIGDPCVGRRVREDRGGRVAPTPREVSVQQRRQL